MVVGALTKVTIGLIRTWCFNPEQLPDPCDIGRAVAVSIKPVATNAVLASWEQVDAWIEAGGAAEPNEKGSGK